MNFRSGAIIAGVGLCALTATLQSGTSKTWVPLAQTKAAPPSAQTLALGKKLAQTNGCNGCHGADYKGKPNFAPSIRSTGSLREYNAQTFARLLNTGLEPDGSKVKKPMPIYKMKRSDSDALYAFLKSLK